ncbi:hypothetical protein BDD12DRAFT_892068 [Trichophaea hybrida]|nr:hypothetical protein BDD12DRAFT_892068 [Trichophaea hybrida]
MQLINIFTTLALLLSIATTTPLVSVNARKDKGVLDEPSIYGDGTGHGSGQLETARAVYFSTNDPTGNAVITIQVDEDGLLAMGNKYPTGGKGGIGIDAKTGKPALPDPLSSQDSLQVGDDFLFVVNAGSNSLSMFSIDTANPTYLTLVGEPVDTQGEFPVSVAYSSALKQACVVNGGAVSNVACYTVDRAAGLAPVEGFMVKDFGLNQTTPPMGPLSTVSDIFFSPDSSGLHVTIKGPNFGDGSLLSFPCNIESRLCKAPTANKPNGTAVLFGSSFINKTTFLAADASFGAVTIQIDKTATGFEQTVLSTTPINGQRATCWTAFSRKTNTVFVTDAQVNHIVEINPDNGSIVSTVNLTNSGKGNFDLQVGGDFLYALSPLKESVSVTVLDLSSGPGAPKEKQTFSIPGIVGQSSTGMQVFPAVSI